MPRSRMRRFGRLLLVLLVLSGAFLFVYSRMRPRFPDEGNLGIDLPTLRVPSADCYERESHRLLLTKADYETMMLRLTWDPGDGEGQVYEVGQSMGFQGVEPGLLERLLAWVRGNPRPPDHPAALVLAGSMDLEDLPVVPGKDIGAVRVYLGGLTKDGSIGAVPFEAHPVACDERCRAGANSTPRDPDGNLVIELRITREEDRVRYRWGPAAFLTKRDVGERFSGGDVTFTADEVAGPGTGPLLPALAECLDRKRPGKYPMWKIVLLEIGSGVRYVDILRAVECAPGDPLVTFQIWPSRQLTLQNLTLPTPLAAGAAVIGEGLDLGRDGRTLVVSMLPDGEIAVRRVDHTLESLRETVAEFDRGDKCVLRIDEGNRFKSVVPVVEMLRAAGLRVYFDMKPLDPALRIETVFVLPAPDPGEARVEVGLETDHADVAGKPVTVHIPDDALVEETLHALIRLKMAGATGFAFE